MVKIVRFHVLTQIVHKNVVSHAKNVLSHAIINASILNAKRNVLRYAIESHANTHAKKILIVVTNA